MELLEEIRKAEAEASQRRDKAAKEAKLSSDERIAAAHAAADKKIALGRSAAGSELKAAESEAVIMRLKILNDGAVSDKLMSEKASAKIQDAAEMIFRKITE